MTKLTAAFTELCEILIVSSTGKQRDLPATRIRLARQVGHAPGRVKGSYEQMLHSSRQIGRESANKRLRLTSFARDGDCALFQVSGLSGKRTGS